MIDIVFPKNNEEEFFEIASKLNYTALCLVYEFKDKKQFGEIKNKLEKLREKTELKLALGALCDKNIQENVADLIIIKPTDKLPKNFDIILAIGSSNVVKWPHLIYRKLNENNKLIGMSFSEILNSNTKEAMLSRLHHFIFLCRKYRLSFALGSYAKDPYEMRSLHDLKSFFLTLGMNTNEVKVGFSSVEEVLEERDVV